MTAVAFAATKVSGPDCIGPLKIARYVLQLPEVWTAAGQAWDLSDDFSYVHGALFGASGAIGDFAYGKLDLIGTYTSGHGMAASGVKIVCHQTGSGDGVAFTSAANSEDFKAVNDMVVWVFGE